MIYILGSVIAALWFITLALIGVVFAFTTNRIKAAEKTVIEHDKRIQKVEDIHGKSINDLDKKVDDGFARLERSLQTLADNVHREKNVENSLMQTLVTLNKTLISFSENTENTKK